MTRPVAARWLFIVLVAAALGRLGAQESWTAVAPPTAQNLWSVAWGNGTFVAVGEGGTILSSPDGLSWSPRSSGYAHWLVGAGYGNALFVVVGEAGTILTSPDGIAWTGRTSGTAARINGVAFGGGRWLAVAESGEVLSSSDASTWTKLQPSPDRLRGLTFAYGQFVITGDNGLVRTTIDTVDYEAKALPESRFVESVVHARRQFLAVGEEGFAVASPDAVTWLRVATGTNAHLRGVSFFNGQFIAVGSDGALLTTAAPALPWTPRPTGTRAVLTAVAAGPGAAVAVGFAGTVLRSAPPPAAPSVLASPRSVQDTVGSNVLFEVVAAGSPPLSYQWTFNGAPMSGQTADRLLLAQVQPADVGAYAVTVSNALGSVTSNAATFSLVTSNAPGPIVDPAFAPTVTFTGPIAAVVEQVDGKLLVGGSQFFVTPGISPFALARFNRDGVLDPTFNLGSGFNAGAAITALALQPDGRLVVGGNFNTYNGEARSNFLRLHPDGSADATLASHASLPSAAGALSVQPDGRILALAGEKLRRYLADGLPDPAFTVLPDSLPVSHFTLLPDGRIVIAARDRSRFEPAQIRRLLPSGVLDASYVGEFAPSFGLDLGEFRFLAARADGSVMVATVLSRRGFTGESIWRIRADGLRDPDWPGVAPLDSRPLTSVITAYAIDRDGRFLQAATFTAYDAGAIPSRTLRRWKADASMDLSFATRTGADGVVRGLTPLRDGATMVYGDFQTFDGVARPRLARLVPANAPDVQAPVIVDVSPDAAVLPGNGHDVTVLAAGSGPLSYASNVGTVTLEADGRARVRVPTQVSGTYLVTFTVRNRAGVATTSPVRITVAPSAPIVFMQPAPISVRPGGSAVLAVDVAGSAPFMFEWFRNGTRVGTGPTLTLSPVTTGEVGDYTVIVRNSLGATTSQSVRVSLDVAARLANISTRAGAASGDQILIAGFVVGGSGRKDIVIRGAGPALAAFSLSGLLPDPVITLFDSAGQSIATNDNWAAATTPATLFTGLGAFPFPAGSADAALRVNLEAGSYTLHLRDTSSRAGVALVELYENDGAPARLVNLSSRAVVGTGASIAISGIVIQGQQSGRFLVRGIGPALTALGVEEALPDPILVLTTATGFTIGSNDNWSTNANAAEMVATAARVAAFPLTPGSRDAALLVTLPPGNYTALVSGAANTTGVALVEIYDVP